MPDCTCVCDMNVATLPYNSHLGIRSCAEPDRLLEIPADLARYGNHLGTVHAGALMSLAEAASGEALLRAIRHLADDVVPVVRRFECKFRKPETGAVHSAAPGMDALLPDFLSSLDSKRRALIEIGVELHDSEGTHCLSATVEWFVAMK